MVVVGYVCSMVVGACLVRRATLFKVFPDTRRGCMEALGDFSDSDSWDGPASEEEGDECVEDCGVNGDNKNSGEEVVGAAPVPSPDTPWVELPACSHPQHCPGCPALTHSPALSLNEYFLHGCCDLAFCKANPPFPLPDPLTGLLWAAAAGAPSNSLRRKFVYQAWFRASIVAGWQTPYFATGPAPGYIQRRIYSGCVLRRLRQTYPDAQYLGFQTY